MTRENLIRKEILFQLYAVRPLPLSADRIARDARKNDYDYTERDVAREAQFLVDEHLIDPVNDPAGTTKRYRILSAGIRHYEETYAA